MPNENLLASDITNWSYAGDHKIRLRLPVQISYGDEPEVAMQRLNNLARKNSSVLKDPPPMVFLQEFGDNGVNLELRVWIDNPDIRGVVRTEIYKAVWKDFHAAGITFPFPQRDVYIKDFPGVALGSRGAERLRPEAKLFRTEAQGRHKGKRKP